MPPHVCGLLVFLIHGRVRTVNGKTILYASLILVGGLLIGVAIRGTSDGNGWTTPR